MRIFIEPNTQVVIGDKHLPQRVVNGPAYVWLVGRRVHSRVSTLPQWLTLTSPECPTATQEPVTFQIACKWSRNLTGFTGHQLHAAARVSNETLESLLHKHLGLMLRTSASYQKRDEGGGNTLEIDAKLTHSDIPAEILLVNASKRT